MYEGFPFCSSGSFGIVVFTRVYDSNSRNRFREVYKLPKSAPKAKKNKENPLYGCKYDKVEIPQGAMTLEDAKKLLEFASQIAIHYFHLFL